MYASDVGRSLIGIIRAACVSAPNIDPLAACDVELRRLGELGVSTARKVFADARALGEVCRVKGEIQRDEYLQKKRDLGG